MDPKTASVADAIVNWTPVQRRECLVQVAKERGDTNKVLFLQEASDATILEVWLRIYGETSRRYGQETPPDA